MINWDELNHIHVIRKLEEVLANWFQIEVFFIDERGQVRNFSENRRDFKNPLCQTILPNHKGRELIFSAMSVANDKLLESEKQSITVDGPLGFEKAHVSRILVDEEFLGSVYAYAYLDESVTEKQLKSVIKTMESLGIDGQDFKYAVSKHKSMSDKDQKYLVELINLVAQEIVTYHTEITRREEQISELNNQLGVRYSYDAMIGKSKPMQQLYSLLDKIKTSESTVLIQGENGTGKELIAKAIHYNSPRKDGPFLTVNCSAFNENLLDSELFGHVKGSFTGAVRDKKGLFESANGGTLFLDEIGDMSLSMQVKLLRVLQDGTLMPVGGTETRKVNVRVLAATNRDLKDMIENALFREDLYYRVNVINIAVPPLRDRKEDIPLLIESFMKRGCSEKSLPLKNIAKRAMEKIYDYNWPGNIRELENEIERLIVLSGQETRISADMLSPRIRDFGQKAKVQGVRVTGRLKDALEELEKTMIKEGLRRTKWNKSRLAKELGISRAGLIMKVEKYGLDKRKILGAKGGSEVA